MYTLLINNEVWCLFDSDPTEVAVKKVMGADYDPDWKVGPMVVHDGQTGERV